MADGAWAAAPRYSPVPVTCSIQTGSITNCPSSFHSQQAVAGQRVIGRRDEYTCPDRNVTRTIGAGGSPRSANQAARQGGEDTPALEHTS